MPDTKPTNPEQVKLKTQHEKNLESIHRRRYLSTIHILPDLRNKKNQDYLETFLTLTALILAAIFAIYPTLSTIVDLQKQLSDAEQIFQQLQTKKDALHSLQTQYTNLLTQPVFNEIFYAIPKSPQLENLAADIQSIGKENHLVQKSISISPVKDATNSNLPANVSTFSVAVSFEGRYQDMQSFLNQVVDIQRIVTIKSVEITKNPADNALALTVLLYGYSVN